ncbi:MAG TPA: hypothetical protein DFS52_07605, partial [Myxococcales bacterium]|nr:hypothetical protein [Myxococcales bacterium]
DTSERPFEPGVRGSSEPGALETSGLELQGADEQADWKGAPAWESPAAEKPIEVDEAAPGPPQAPAEPKAAEPAPGEVLLELELSPEEIG